MVLAVSDGVMAAAEGWCGKVGWATQVGLANPVVVLHVAAWTRS